MQRSVQVNKNIFPKLIIYDRRAAFSRSVTNSSFIMKQQTSSDSIDLEQTH